MSFIIQGDEKLEAALRLAAATVDLRMRGDFETAVDRIAADYRSGIGRASGRTAAGVASEIRQSATGLEGEVYNDHFAAGFHEYGGARSAPNPALQQAVVEHAPRWVDAVARKAGDV